MHIELDTKHCDLSAGESEAFEEKLSPLRKLIDSFPVSDLYITVTHNARSQDYHVKVSLILTGKTLVTAYRNFDKESAFEHCIKKLVERVGAYKANLDQRDERSKYQKGAQQKVEATFEPEWEHLSEAVKTGDYGSFRYALLPFEESLRKRIGRWVQRYPELDAQVGSQWSLDDLVEEVLFNAFDQWEQRPTDEEVSGWLEKWIDPSMKAVLEHPEQEKEAIERARTLRETPTSPDRSSGNKR